MKLTGIIQNSMGGFVTLRGYADIVALFNISEAKNYQRNINCEHLSEIQDFYAKGINLFYPEVILSYTFSINDWQRIIQEVKKKEIDFLGNAFWTAAQNNISIKLTDDRIKFKPFKNLPGGLYGLEIDIEDAWLILNKKPFARVDGNHRLSAHEALSISRRLNPIPFCIILFPYENSENLQKSIFHNINSKARSLTTEEELKGILSNQSFSDEELQVQFGWNYYQTKLLANDFHEETLCTLSNVKNAFKESSSDYCINSVLLKLIDFLRFNSLIKEDEEDLSRIIDSFELINIAFANKQKLIESNNSAFLIAAVGISINGKHNLKVFANWLSKNHLCTLKEVNAQSLYDIYIKLNEHGPKVFVAMPFNERKLADYQHAYDNAVKNINALNSDINLNLFKIMSHIGEAVDIVPKMINQIEDCTIFIADISEANPNVAYELGFAKGLKKSLIFVQNEDDKSKVPFDYTQTSRHVYSSYTELTTKVTDNIKAILSEKGYSFN